MGKTYDACEICKHERVKYLEEPCLSCGQPLPSNWESKGD